MLTVPVESQISSPTAMGRIVKREGNLSSLPSKAIPMPGYANAVSQEESLIVMGHISSKSTSNKTPNEQAPLLRFHPML